MVSTGFGRQSIPYLRDVVRRTRDRGTWFYATLGLAELDDVGGICAMRDSLHHLDNKQDQMAELNSLYDLPIRRIKRQLAMFLPEMLIRKEDSIGYFEVKLGGRGCALAGALPPQPAADPALNYWAPRG